MKPGQPFVMAVSPANRVGRSGGRLQQERCARHRSGQSDRVGVQCHVPTLAMLPLNDRVLQHQVWERVHIPLVGPLIAWPPRVGESFQTFFDLDHLRDFKSLRWSNNF